jgi:D-aspartate ligase
MQPPTSSRSQPAQLVPAVVVGGTLNGLGVVRSLARGHMPIYLLETTRQCAAGWSWHSRYVRVPALDGPGFSERLVNLGKQLACRPVLILTSDQSVNWVSSHRSEIEPWYRISLPSDDMVRALADKTLFQQLAEREGLPVPRTVCVTDVADVAQLTSLTPPLIVKPADKTLVLNGAVERVVQAATVTEAQVACRNMLARAPRIVVQEWIDGPDDEITFTLFSCDDEGRILGIFPGRKLLCSPPAVGSTAVCVAAPEVAEELRGPTLQFIRCVGYRGLGSLEFKRDPRSGRSLIIEPTVGRTDWQEEIATLCGVNLPLLSYLDALGVSTPPVDGSFPSVAWRSTAAFRTPLARGLRMIDGFFRWSDPLPALYYYVFERALLRLWRRAVRLGAAVRARLLRNRVPE